MDNNHYFNINVAKRYGVNCAIILQNLLHWIEYNTKEGKNLFDGKYWTYNPIKEFNKQFPYLTERQIRTALDTLRDEELVLTANYNKTCDRTLWYTVTQKALDIMNNQDKQEAQVDVSTPEDDLEEETDQSISAFIDAQNAEPDEEYFIENDSNSSESTPEVQKSQNVMTSESIRNDIQVNTYCHTSQNVMTPVSNGTNNKPQIINSNNKLNQEKEIYKEKEPPERQIFDFWNSKKLLKTPELSEYLQKVISTALKSFTLEQLKLSISRYDEMLNSAYCFTHCWTINSFLSSGKAIKGFLDNGEKWESYVRWKQFQKDAGKQDKSIWRKYTPEQVNSLITNLDDWEV